MSSLFNSEAFEQIPGQLSIEQVPGYIIADRMSGKVLAGPFTRYVDAFNVARTFTNDRGQQIGTVRES